MDIGMPNLNGLEASRRILRNNPQSKILILTIEDGDELLRAVIEAGARGIVFKSDASRDLLKAVEVLQCDGTFFTSRIAEMMRTRDARQGQSAAEERLSLPVRSGRQREIIQLMAEGKSSKQIASHLNLSVKTVDTHRTNLMRKLNLHSVSELVMFAVKNKMVQVVVFPVSTPTTKSLSRA
jgi:DNA-binding NarL/FixJ family response regulator